MLVYWLFRLGTLVLPWIPAPVGHRLAGWAGQLAYRLGGRARRTVLANLSHVLPPQAGPATLQQATCEVFCTAARNYFDLFRLPSLRLEQLDRLVHVDGYEHFAQAAASGRGVVVVSAHFGNFDLVGQVLAARHVDMLVPVEPLKPPALLALVTGLRRCKGLSFVPLGPATLRTALRLLQRGGVVGLAVDRDLQHNGIRVPFFGEETSMPAGAVELARRTRALIVPAFGRRYADGTYAIAVEPALDPTWTADAEGDRRRVLGEVLAIVERHIRVCPGQWIVFSPIWSQPATGKGPYGHHQDTKTQSHEDGNRDGQEGLVS